MMDKSTNFPSLLVFTILALVVVLVIAWLAIRLLANLNKSHSNSARAVRVLQSVAVGSRERLVLVSYKDSEILLGVTAGSISVIDNSTTRAEAQEKTGVIQSTPE